MYHWFRTKYYGFLRSFLNDEILHWSLKKPFKYKAGFHYYNNLCWDHFVVFICLLSDYFFVLFCVHTMYHAFDIKFWCYLCIAGLSWTVSIIIRRLSSNLCVAEWRNYVITLVCIHQVNCNHQAFGALAMYMIALLCW